MVEVSARLRPGNERDPDLAQLVAFLRGVNLGRRRVKMEDLRRAFAGMGWPEARTLIASGNVLFEAEASEVLAATIESGLEAAFGFEVPTIIRSVDYLVDLVATDPFAGFEADPDTKLYVFFLAHPDSSLLQIPRAEPADYEVVGLTDSEIFAVGHRMSSGRFGPGLDKISQPFGTAVTNRNWNTVIRLIEKASA